MEALKRIQRNTHWEVIKAEDLPNHGGQIVQIAPIGTNDCSPAFLCEVEDNEAGGVLIVETMNSKTNRIIKRCKDKEAELMQQAGLDHWDRDHRLV